MNSQLVRNTSDRPGRAFKPRHSEGGYVLVAATAIVAVLLGTGLAFMRWSTDEAHQAEHVSAAIQAYYLGQMGVVEQGFQWLRNRREADIPNSEVSLGGRPVPGFGRYEDVRVFPMNRVAEGDFFTQQRWYRISAVGVSTIPWYQDGRNVDKEVKRRAVLYVKVRSFSDYMYLSNYEMTTFGDRIRFWSQDTLNGRVHSNFQIAIMQSPVFYEQVTQAGSWNDFERGSSYNPIFLGPPPIFHAQPVEIPEVAANLRANATHYRNPGPNRQQRMLIFQNTIHLWTWPRGVAFDSLDVGTQYENFPLQGEICFFTESPLELKGFEIRGTITVGSAQLVRLVDDVRVDGPFSMGAPQYRVAENNPYYIGIVSEGDIKIANSIQNGRENCSGFGPNGTNNQGLKDIVITAAVVALGNYNTTLSAGSFTFENQNDADSGYVGPNPDERGVIWLWGSITQKRRGYVHRSNQGGTGYDKQYRYDRRFLKRRPPCFFDAVDSTGRALFDFVQWGQGIEPRTEQNAGRVLRYN